MKHSIEFWGVFALWSLGMVTTFPATWSSGLLMAIAVCSSVIILIYCWTAISAKRKGDLHYFVMAVLGAVLTIVSLTIPAMQMTGGKQFLLILLAACVLVLIIYVAMQTYLHKRKLAHAGAA